MGHYQISSLISCLKDGPLSRSQFPNASTHTTHCVGLWPGNGTRWQKGRSQIGQKPAAVHPAFPKTQSRILRCGIFSLLVSSPLPPLVMYSTYIQSGSAILLHTICASADSHGNINRPPIPLPSTAMTSSSRNQNMFRLRSRSCQAPA